MNATETIALAFYEEAKVRFPLQGYNVLYDGERRLASVTIRKFGTSLDYGSVVFGHDKVVVDCYKLNRRHQGLFAYETPWVEEVLDLLTRHMNNAIPREEYQ